MTNETLKLIAVAIIASLTTLATQHYMGSYGNTTLVTQLDTNISELKKVEINTTKKIVEQVKSEIFPEAPKMQSMYEAEAMKRVDVFYSALEEYKYGQMKVRSTVDTTTRAEREKMNESLSQTLRVKSGLDDYHLEYFMKHLTDYGTNGPTGGTKFMELARKLSAFPDNNYRGYLKTDAFMIAARHPEIRRILANKIIVYLNDHPELAATK